MLLYALLLVSQSYPFCMCVVLCCISDTAVSAAPSDTPNHTVRATGTPVRAARFVRRPACCLPAFSGCYLLNFHLLDSLLPARSGTTGAGGKSGGSGGY